MSVLFTDDDKLSEKFYDRPILKKNEVEIIYQFIQSFNQR